MIPSPWSFSNDCEGFVLFKKLLDSLEGEEKIALIIAVFNERLCHFEKPVDVILLSH